MATILVTGAANGLGAAFIKAYQGIPGNNIIAVDREHIADIPEHAASYKVDVSDAESIESLTTKIKGEPIDLVLHCAGIRGLVPEMEVNSPGKVAACETMEVMNLDTLMKTFQVNSAGTFLLLRALLPNLRQAKGKVIVMSSRMGSIGNNEVPNRAAGASYAYRASKAAQNMIVRSLAVDEPDVTFVLCHPGRVETKLVKWKEEGAISAEESVKGLLPLIAKWNKQDSGRFYDRFGERLEW